MKKSKSEFPMTNWHSFMDLTFKIHELNQKGGLPRHQKIYVVEREVPAGHWFIAKLTYTPSRWDELMCIYVTDEVGHIVKYAPYDRIAMEQGLLNDLPTDLFSYFMAEHNKATKYNWDLQEATAK